MGRSFTLAQIGEYYNTSHLLRPINAKLVEEYARHIENKVRMPNIILGRYTGQDGKEAKLIVDGNHIYRACHVAKVKHWPIEVMTFNNLAEALAEQLRRNITHGLHVTTAQRDSRIRQLLEVYNWTVRQVADAVGIHFSSVSRISRNIQNVSKTGKRGATTDTKRESMAPHVLTPRQALRAVENLHETLAKVEGRTMLLGALYDPKRPVDVTQSLIGKVRDVGDWLGELVAGPRAVSKAA